tara:strand:- start:17989 stop:18744 length:756 start_codon:yes stop_codon:yes gene_type:complete
MTKNKVFYGRKKVSVNKKRGNIIKIFTEVSYNYDKMNDIMSLGTHRLWKKDLVDKISYNLSNKKVSKILDIAGGTGDISLSILKKYPNNNITILDLTPEMIKVGKSKAIEKNFIYNPIWIAGDSAELPFQNSIYDIITCSFGIRNVAEIEKTLLSSNRVLKPGGKIFILEFSPKIAPPFQNIYEFYLKNIIPLMGKKFANNKNAYQYLAESIETFYTPEKFKKIMENAGFKILKIKKYMGGIACLYIATKI